MEQSGIKEIFDILSAQYPDAHCELSFGSEFELLVAVMLSAQCTDKRVNLVTRELFKRFNSPQDFASLSEEELEPHIYSCGFYRAKARSIISASRDIITRFGGRVPRTMEELLSLKGVGRKTANVVLSVAFDRPAMAVDTHVYRTSRRIGLSDKATPEGVELDLLALIPEETLQKAHHLLIFLGRYTCHSKNPDCGSCGLTGHCKFFQNRSG